MDENVDRGSCLLLSSLAQKLESKEFLSNLKNPELLLLVAEVLKLAQDPGSPALKSGIQSQQVLRHHMTQVGDTVKELGRVRDAIRLLSNL